MKVEDSLSLIVVVLAHLSDWRSVARVRSWLTIRVVLVYCVELALRGRAEILVVVTLLVVI